MWDLSASKRILLDCTIVIGLSVTKNKNGYDLLSILTVSILLFLLSKPHKPNYYCSGTAVGVVATWRKRYNFTKYYVRASLQNGGDRVIS